MLKVQYGILTKYQRQGQQDTLPVMGIMFLNLRIILQDKKPLL